MDSYSIDKLGVLSFQPHYSTFPLSRFFFSLTEKINDVPVDSSFNSLLTSAVLYPTGSEDSDF